jgi:hypothetical protein
MNINSQTTDVVIGLSGPARIVLNGNDVYINELAVINSIKGYPNPSNRIIQIAGLTKNRNYKMYTVLGVEVNKGFIAIKRKN